jgi:hypothetical protein
LRTRFAEAKAARQSIFPAALVDATGAAGFAFDGEIDATSGVPEGA